MQQARRLFPAWLLGALWPCELGAGRKFEVARKYQVRISANVTGDFGNVTGLEPVLGCARGL